MVNASGPGAARTAGFAGLRIPVEPRKRCLFIFDCREDPGQALPLTIGPAGVHCRPEGEYYLCGTAPEPDTAPARG